MTLPSSLDAPSAALGARLQVTLADLALARAWQGAAARDRETGPRPVVSPLASWQSESHARPTDVTAEGLWAVIHDPRTDQGAALRSGFVDRLVAYCVRTVSNETSAVDLAAARTQALRLLHYPAHTDVGRALRAMMARCPPASYWASVCAVVADALAPPAVQAAWSLACVETGRRGRPRRDRTRLTGEEARALWGHAVLPQVLDAWCDTTPDRV